MSMLESDRYNQNAFQLLLADLSLFPLTTLPGELILYISRFLGPLAFLLNLVCHRLRSFGITRPTSASAIFRATFNTGSATLTRYLIDVLAFPHTVPIADPSTHCVVIQAHFTHSDGLRVATWIPEHVPWSWRHFRAPLVVACSENRPQMVDMLLRYPHTLKQLEFAQSIAVVAGHTLCLDVLQQHDHHVDVRKRVVAAAASGNRQELADYLSAAAHEMSVDDAIMTLGTAALHGHVDVVRSLLNGLLPTSILPITVDFSHVAAFGGHVNVLKLLHDRHWLMNGCVEGAAINGRLECLKFAREIGCSFDSIADMKVAGIDCLRYLLDLGHQPGPFWWEYAARTGSIDCLRLLMHFDLSEDWMWLVAKQAAQNNHLAVLRYLHEAGVAFNDGINGIDGIIHHAAVAGHLDCVVYLHSLGYSLRQDLLRTANLSCLQFLHKHGGPLPLYDWETTSLECVQYVHAHGVPWNAEPCAKFARQGLLNCVQFAHENGCAWDAETCHQAAFYGQLDILQYAHKNGCSWNERTCVNACRNNHFECLKYAHENGCPWDVQDCLRRSTFSKDCNLYVRQQAGLA